MNTYFLGLFRVLDSLQLFEVYALLGRQIHNRKVAIIQYHRVNPSDDLWSLHPIHPHLFECQIRYLCENFSILPIEELISINRGNVAPPKPTVAITFDDGYKDIYEYAYPILNKYGISATVFLSTGNINTATPFWWDVVSYIIFHTKKNEYTSDVGHYRFESMEDKQRAILAIKRTLRGLPDERKNTFIEEMKETLEISIPDEVGRDLVLSWNDIKTMSDTGIHFEAHTVHHPNLSQLPISEAHREILQSKADIEYHLGKIVKGFSYPHGAFTQELATFVEKSGFVYAVCNANQRWIRAKDNLYSLPRIDLTPYPSFYKLYLSGMYEDAHTLFDHISPAHDSKSSDY